MSLPWLGVAKGAGTRLAPSMLDFGPSTSVKDFAFERELAAVAQTQRISVGIVDVGEFYLVGDATDTRLGADALAGIDVERQPLT